MGKADLYTPCNQSRLIARLRSEHGNIFPLPHGSFFKHYASCSAMSAGAKYFKKCTCQPSLHLPDGRIFS